ncbi:MAG: hypothetical protein KGJ62_00630 [Armatimonadetes bacterium]|nr:hypothetical protein [Armatimonadota bacterium]MDE2205152.1 hypothetical protein [Armatimonadota bacterium]
MRRNSWLLLAAAGVISVILGVGYSIAGAGSGGTPQQQVSALLSRLKTAAEHKDTGGVMNAFATQSNMRVTSMNRDQFERLVDRGMNDAGTLQIEMNHISIVPSGPEMIAEFDLGINESRKEYQAQDYTGHIVLRLRRVSVATWFGLVRVRRWRIVSADTTGPDPANFGDY